MRTVKLPALSAQAVHLYLLRHDRATLPDAALTPAEQGAAARFRLPADRARFRLGRLARRVLLAHYTGTPPAALTFAETPYGKPYLPGADLAFNVAHAGDLVAVALARGTQLGVDVEPLRAIPDRDEMAALVFTPAERARLALADAPDRAFLDHWTAKEALIKGIGLGLSYPVAAVTAHFDAAPAFTRPGHDLSAWRLARGTHDGHLWALAWDGGPRTVTVFTPDTL